MTLAHPFYVMLFEDFSAEQASARFFAVSDAAAIAFANDVQGLSTARLEHLYRVSELGPLVAKPAEAGSNIKSKALFVWRSSAGAPIRMTVPSIDLTIVGPGHRTTELDLAGGVGRLQSRNGFPAAAFVKGQYLYGFRKRDLAP